MFILKEWVCYLKMIIEFDFNNVVFWFNIDEGGLWKVIFVLNYIRFWRYFFLGVEIKYKGCMSNGVVDVLVK